MTGDVAAAGLTESARPAVLRLAAPLSGWAMPHEQIPDPVFAGGLLGQGIGIDPTSSVLVAPCAGRVRTVHPAHHALTLAVDGGPDLILHIGLDTVSLKGEGFTPHVTDGQAVAAGDRLISFDMDGIARRASSLISPMVAVGDGWVIASRVTGRLVQAGEVVIELAPAGAGAAAAAAAPADKPPAAGEVASATVVIRDAGGLHARPAGLIAEAASRFRAETTLTAHGRSVSARSPVLMLSLGTEQNEPIEIRAVGPDAREAVAAIRDLIAGGLERAGPGTEAPAAPQPAAPATSAPPPAANAAPDARVLRGVTASPGLAIGKALLFQRQALEIAEQGAGPEVEEARLKQALAEAENALAGLIAAHPNTRDADILRAHVALLRDPELAAAAQQLIRQGKSAAFAWQRAVETQVAQLLQLGKQRFAERADDLRDVARRVQMILAGRHQAAQSLPPETILLADDLLPTELAALDLTRIVGLCTAAGGPTSHVAILAASHGIPALVAAGPGVLRIPEGRTVLLDASEGYLDPDPDPSALEAARRRLERLRSQSGSLRDASQKPCRLADGTAIDVVANLGALEDVAPALAAGAEGCGLLRTEFLFLGRTTAPTEDEQYASYQAIATALGGRKLIIRTLDPAADKVLPYLGLPPEPNPSLGMRGIRAELWKPELLRAQLRAIMRVQPADQCLVMLPMVATLDELRHVRGIVEEERQRLKRAEPVRLGIMVEVPSAALTSEMMATEADFFSVGTNDLTQYVLAMDRSNPQLAPQVDALHPAVLELIGRAASGASRHGRWTGVCGSIASDPTAAPVLVGLGVTELSAIPAAIPRIKAVLSRFGMAACRGIAAEALRQPSAAAVRALLARMVASGEDHPPQDKPSPGTGSGR